MDKARIGDRTEQVRRSGLLKKYGLTPEEFYQLETLSDGKCAICNEAAKLNVDHDHATGKVRGLLCRSCNLALGLMKDNVFILISAIEYLGGIDEKQAVDTLMFKARIDQSVLITSLRIAESHGVSGLKSAAEIRTRLKKNQQTLSNLGRILKNSSGAVKRCRCGHGLFEHAQRCSGLRGAGWTKETAKTWQCRCSGFQEASVTKKGRPER